MSDKDTGANFVAGFIFGAAIGVVIGLLYAPKPGQEMREVLRHKVDEVKEKAGEAAVKAKEGAAESRRRVEGKLGGKKTAK